MLQVSGVGKVSGSPRAAALEANKIILMSFARIASNTLNVAMVFCSIIVGILNGTLSEVVNAVPQYAKIAFNLALGLTGIMAFWLGLMKVAENAGLIQWLSRVLRPLMTRLFPDVPADHPAMGAMVMNIAANMLGLANAATPLGLKAMDELETLNKQPGIATNAMCTFLAINTSSVQLIPTTAIAYLAAAGSKNPTIIIATALAATFCSTAVAIVAVKFFERLPWFRLTNQEKAL